MNINGNYGNMAYYGNTPNYGNAPSFQIPYPMPPVYDDVKFGYGNMPSLPSPYPMPRIIDDCGPKGGIIPNFQGPVGADTINFFGKTGPDVINYFGKYDPKSYTMQSYDCPPGVYNMVDVSWETPNYPQPVYYPKAVPSYNWGAK